MFVIRWTAGGTTGSLPVPPGERGSRGDNGRRGESHFLHFLNQGLNHGRGLWVWPRESGGCGAGEGAVGGSGGGGEVAGTPASRLQVVLHIIGLHVEGDEAILDQVLNGIKWLLPYGHREGWSTVTLDTLLRGHLPT